MGGDKIDDIFFDKNLNDAYFIGEGVEIVEEVRRTSLVSRDQFFTESIQYLSDLKVGEAYPSNQLVTSG